MKSTTKTVESSGGIKPAAVYVRMSTEHQQYSTNNQMDVILGYAHLRSMEIVREYSDEGKSGLNIAGRDALARMIDDVRSGEAPFQCILVYDVSRWGRFQDADENGIELDGYQYDNLRFLFRMAERILIEEPS
jgi:DNA invertase Pin-like site-specific DNA recombinase